MDITPEMEQLRSELEAYAEGRHARFDGAARNEQASLAWKYGWADVNDQLARLLTASVVERVETNLHIRILRL